MLPEWHRYVITQLNVPPVQLRYVRTADQAQLADWDVPERPTRPSLQNDLQVEVLRCARVGVAKQRVTGPDEGNLTLD